MIQFRNNVFETNSSSTHALSIPKQGVNIPAFVEFHIGDYGWEFDEVSAPDYLYTALLLLDNIYDEGYVNRLKDILDKNWIAYYFNTPKYIQDKYDSYPFLDNGYIDHFDELHEFIDKLMENEKQVLNFIFGGKVKTGNDNCDGKNWEWLMDRSDDSFMYFTKGN